MKKLILVLCVASVLIMLAGCGALGNDPNFDAATVVLPYLASTAQDGSFRFDAGPYKDGTAVLGGNGMAFWVMDGTGYVVNDVARKAAPELRQAPSEIQHDAAFVAAARAGE